VKQNISEQDEWFSIFTGLCTRSSLLTIDGAWLPRPLTAYQWPTFSFKSIDTRTWYGTSYSLKTKVKT